MAKRFGEFFMTLLLLSLCVGFALSAAGSPESAPSQAPAHVADSPTPVFNAPTTGAPNPVSDSLTSSPPSPPPENQAPGSSPDSSPSSSPPSPSPASEKSPVPTPSPDANDVNPSHINVNGEEQEESSGGMSGGKKAGIAVGVIAAACLVGLGGFVYKKRQNNIRRSQYGYAARREIL